MPDGNAEQVRLVADQVADAAISRFASTHPELRRTEVPPPLKWAGGIIAAIFTAGVCAMALWLVSTVSDMQVTLARMDERMAGQATSQLGQFEDISRRVTRLESYHAKGGDL